MTSTESKGNAHAGGRLIPSRKGPSALKAFQRSLMMLVDFRLAIPYLLYFLLQISMMLLYLFNKSGPATSLWTLLLGDIPGDALSHYPQHLILMQPVLNRLDMILDVFVRIVFHGATVCLVASALGRGKVSLSRSFSTSMGRYLHLLPLSIISSVAVYVVIYIGMWISSGHPGLTGQFIKGAGIAGALVVQVFFLYAIPFVVIGKRSFLGAVAAGFYLSRHSFTKSFILVAIPFIITIPATFLSMKAEMIALQLSPDFMIHNHVASKIMELISTYLLTASATVVFLTGTQPVAGPKGRKTGHSV